MISIFWSTEKLRKWENKREKDKKKNMRFWWQLLLLMYWKHGNQIQWYVHRPRHTHAQSNMRANRLKTIRHNNSAVQIFKKSNPFFHRTKKLITQHANYLLWLYAVFLFVSIFTEINAVQLIFNSNLLIVRYSLFVIRLLLLLFGIYPWKSSPYIIYSCELWSSTPGLDFEPTSCQVWTRKQVKIYEFVAMNVQYFTWMDLV